MQLLCNRTLAVRAFSRCARCGHCSQTYRLVGSTWGRTEWVGHHGSKAWAVIEWVHQSYGGDTPAYTDIRLATCLCGRMSLTRTLVGQTPCSPRPHMSLCQTLPPLWRASPPGRSLGAQGCARHLTGEFTCNSGWGQDLPLRCTNLRYNKPITIPQHLFTGQRGAAWRGRACVTFCLF